MRLKESRPTLRTNRFASLLRRRPLLRALAFLFYSAILIMVGIWMHSTGLPGEVVKLGRELTNHPIRRLKATYKAEPEHLVIDIKQKHYQKIAYHRQRSLEKGYLFVSTDDYVPAEIRYKGKATKVKLRLKGDFIDHIQGDKWSFRVIVKGDDSLFGMKQFSIHHPNSRRFLHEWVYHKAMRREGVIALRYDFITVSVNGKDLGVYAIEEHFEKRLLENNDRREGPIVRFDESLMWEAIRRRSSFKERIQLTGTYFASDVDGFQTGRWMATPAGREIYVKAMHLLEAFRRGEMSTSEVFDIEKLATFYAISDVLGAPHGTAWHNVRFYHNPVTSRLEPIAFDGNPGKPIAVLSALRDGVIHPRHSERQTKSNPDYYGTLFRDERFYRAYIAELDRLSQAGWLDDLLKENDTEIERNMTILHTEFPENEFSPAVYYRNQRYVRGVLEPPRALNCYVRRISDTELQLDMSAVKWLPVEVLEVKSGNESLLRPDDLVIPGHDSSGPVAYQSVVLRRDGDAPWTEELINSIVVNHRILGAGRLSVQEAYKWSYLDLDALTKEVMRRAENVSDFEFLRRDDLAQHIVADPGDWMIDKTMVIPPGYTFVAGPGVRFNLSNGAMILSRSPLHFVGEPGHPVLVHSSNSDGQGMIVVGAGSKSILKHVVFDNLSNPTEKGWGVTGAVTFHESDVEILNTHFLANRCEDALNTIRCKFMIDGALFRGTQSDAFDSDFCQGSIANTRFEKIGNDGIDVSGSIIEVSGVDIIDAGDKGLSAGERSTMTATRVNMTNNGVAVASKDMSHVDISASSITGSKLALTAYQKKPEFGAASVKATGLKLKDVETKFLIEEGSSVQLDGRDVPPNHKDVKELMYGVEYGKASKR